MLNASHNPMLATILYDGTKQVYQLTGMQGTTGFVFAFFGGRPAGGTLSPIAKDIFSGKRKPLAAHDTKSHSIIISVDTAKPGGSPSQLSVHTTATSLRRSKTAENEIRSGSQSRLRRLLRASQRVRLGPHR